jgi:hypothetical protein
MRGFKTQSIEITSNELSFMCTINVWDYFIVYIIQSLKLYIKDIISKNYESIRIYYKLDIEHLDAVISDSYDYDYILDHLNHYIEKYNDAFCSFKLTGLHTLFKIFNIQNTKKNTNISYGNIIDLNETLNMLEPYLLIEEDEKANYEKAHTCFMYLKNIFRHAIDNHNYASINGSDTNINDKIYHCDYFIDDKLTK